MSQFILKQQSAARPLQRLLDGDLDDVSSSCEEFL